MPVSVWMPAFLFSCIEEVNAMDMVEAMGVRHSVRSYTDRQIEGEVRAKLEITQDNKDKKEKSEKYFEKGKIPHFAHGNEDF